MTNFVPKSIFKITNSDGTISRAEEWNVGDIGNGDLSSGINYTKEFFISFLISAIASPLLLILSIFTYSGKYNIFNIIGIIVGTYFLIDMYNNWIINTIINLFITDNISYFLVELTTGAIFGHLILLIYSIINSNDGFKLNSNILLFIIIIFSMFGFTYGINQVKAHGTFKEYKISKNKENIIKEKEVERTSNMSFDEIEQENTSRLEKTHEDEDKNIEELHKMLNN